MKKNTITTLQRAVASVLLLSQLLTSCGVHETIVPSKEHLPQGTIDLSDDHPISSALPIAYSPSLATASDQGYESEGSSESCEIPTYTTREGHQIQLLAKRGKYVAALREKLPPGFTSTPSELPVYFQEGLSAEALRSSSYVEVVNRSYVVFADHGGLLGGAKRGISLEVDTIIQLMTL